MPNGVSYVAIVERPIEIGALISAVHSNRIGALSIFLGTVREVNDGRRVSGMDYEAYGSMAESELGRIVSEVRERESELRVAIEHRVGALALGDVSVAIVCAHPHRAPAITACSRIIEELKQRVPVWKREHYLDGDRQWLDPTAPAVSEASNASHATVDAASMQHAPGAAT